LIKEFLEIGEIVGTHGVRGEIRVNPWCDSPDFMTRFKTLYFDSNGSCAVQVKAARPHGNIVLLTIDGVTTVEQAQKLRGKVLHMKRSDAKLPKGKFFIAELIGCEVFDADDPAKKYGTLSDVSATGANDVWHIENGGKEYLIPAIPDVVIETDVEAGKVIIRPLKGIFDDED
jgi:16S rRNA processing protein RimM